MDIPDDRRYSETHEWHKLDGDLLTLGLTRFAVDQLTDITYVEMKEPGTSVGAGDSVGEIESVKTTSDVYCGVAGEIVEVNPALGDDPSLVNEDPFGRGWLVKIRTPDAGALEDLMDSEAYARSISG